MTPPTNESSTLTGILIVNKPKGPTSMDVIRVVRKRSGIRKIGHAGTLDPLATGVVVVCIGRPATRTIDQLMATEKTYRATLNLAATSETDDAEGPVHPVEVDRQPTLKEIHEILAQHFTRTIMQIPPRHSAIKVDGQRAYKLARKGAQLKLRPRPVIIHEIKIEAYEFPHLILNIRCGKGTYIRSLARDLGQALEVGGYLTDLCRTAVGQYKIVDAIRLDDIPDPLTQTHLLPAPTS